MLKQKFSAAIVFSCLLALSFSAKAQPAWTFDIFGKEKKPEKYEEKLLASEKTGTKKFGVVRRFMQNTTSHYNFFFNANNKINSVVERAKISNKDDFASLLSFYGYSLDNTASQKTELDSVIYKATAGVLLHDLRSEWVDNFYLLIGKSYFLRKDFDSAALTFQFINYNLFPRKKKNDDDDKIVGSNETGTGIGTGSVSIANKEKRNFVQKVMTLPPSRNEALIWQIRTFIEQKEMGDAAGLISILQNDINLPKRLQNDLHEVTAYWFFAQGIYDSSAVHLEKALSNADTKEDKSRWKFLLAQMYEQTGDYKKAEDFYAQAAKSTTDVVMDIYAKLNSAKMMRNTDNTKELDKSIATLLHMARKDKYEAFRDIIYYSAAQLSIQKTDTLQGISLYKKSIEKNLTASVYRDKSFLQLANIAYNQKNYRDAHSYYDSINVIVKDKNIDSATIADRKEILGRLAPKIIEIEKQDSLQMLAALSPTERTAFVKKLAKKYRKENGLKEEEEFSGSAPITFASKSNEPVDLFETKSSSSGQWYFYNTSLKAKGFNDFKNKWGKRANVDNWRRKASSQSNNITQVNGRGLDGNLDPDAPLTKEEKEQAVKATDYSFDGLMGGLPLTQALMDSSNIIIAKNLYEAAQIFQNELQDYEQAIVKYEDFVKRFSSDAKLADVYLGLSFCYGKLGNTSKAELYKNLVKTNFAGSNAAKIISNPSLLNPNGKNAEVTAKYEGIYNMFLEGKFDQAIAEKKKADSTNGTNYWSPQLLYIESVYHIKARNDSAAIAALQNIIALYPTSGLKEKAITLIDVLGRRDSIERYLTQLQVTRVEEEQVIFVDDNPVIKKVIPVVTKPAEVKLAQPVVIKKVASDSIKVPEVFKNKNFELKPESPHYVVMILDKVDGVYINEAKNAFVRFNKGSMETLNTTIKKDTLDATKAILIFTPFENAAGAIKYFDKIKRAAPSEVSWLQATKYSFIIISEENLQLLKTNKDVTSYKQLLNANFGNKF
jgi:tetratricopeptide (TPR) repeat protein